MKSIELMNVMSLILNMMNLNINLTSKVYKLLILDSIFQFNFFPSLRSRLFSSSHFFGCVRLPLVRSWMVQRALPSLLLLLRSYGSILLNILCEPPPSRKLYSYPTLYPSPGARYYHFSVSFRPLEQVHIIPRVWPIAANSPSSKNTRLIISSPARAYEAMLRHVLLFILFALSLRFQG